MESPDPLDLLAQRSESPVIQSVARLIGHEAVDFLAKSPGELKSVCDYLASLSKSQCVAPSRPLCLHLSAHGNKSGMGFGKDILDWRQLGHAIASFFDAKVDYSGPRLLVLSACDANAQDITSHIERDVATAKSNVYPPRFIFVPRGEIAWQDAAVAWGLFYRLIADVDLDEPKQVRRLLDKIKATGLADFWYFRWDNHANKYRRYKAKTRA